MNETTPQWDDLRLFLAVAEARGLAGAARATGRSAATLGRRMVALERALGAAVFHRHARGYDLTAEGAALLARVQGIAHQIDALAPQGAADLIVTISAGTWVTWALLQQVAALEVPGARLRFVSAEATADIGRREALIGVRNARPEAAGLAARRLARVRFAGFARQGAPDRWIAVMAETPSARWVRAQAGRAALTVAAPRNALDLALAGQGRAVLPCFVGDAAGLDRVTPEIDDLTHDQWLVSHETDRHLPPVRAVLDRLVPVLRGLG